MDMEAAIATIQRAWRQRRDDACLCAICLSDASDPVAWDGCGHSFCRTCAVRWSKACKAANHPLRCPTCRTRGTASPRPALKIPDQRAVILPQGASDLVSRNIASLFRRMRDRTPFSLPPPMRRRRSNFVDDTSYSRRVLRV
ncbi:hypothetical protein EMIHUDRAFT_440390 [Emiliania huxleyi CCMP1516]|uniref:RING-type domain-containing protein n=2 Tax=Emiliania huxleyi TaxID=2903 RepID=A0A0D3KNQ8_EMIH1|nr:hypothetical protein EMIHUDRAFT_440390 [Emiliania huxleyi CCMP1516]EOD37393.1 hypothetical protein EMIHUDRAFT_440390 [Emiliania huxleyi CCMP1516]|eukprot:XP_005789822.1 hypothetical protein EMIHUDRAFT_440390 [Emiliania huxleyi CCMP1516]